MRDRLFAVGQYRCFWCGHFFDEDELKLDKFNRLCCNGCYQIPANRKWEMLNDDTY